MKSTAVVVWAGLMPLILLVSAAVCPADPYEEPDPPENVVTGTYTVDGVFLWFEVGDYVHPVILASSGDTVCTWMRGTDAFDLYLVLHAGEQMTFYIETVDTWVWEADATIRVDRLYDAATESVTFDEWLADALVSSSVEELERKYEFKLYRFFR
jgi:hypothetical protein